MSRQRAAEIVGEAAGLASQRLTARGLPALPNTTPHSLRRTYISIAPEESSLKKQKGPASRAFRGGETRTRTGDTTIFSRVLYQLSYLAVGA